MVATSAPQSFKEEVASTEREYWQAAMEREIYSLIEKKVFDLVLLLKGTKAIRCR